MNTTGKKITQVVRVDATIAPATCLVPISALGFRSSPSSSRRRMIFSSTTMALSTINPTPRAKPPKLIWFSVRSLKYNNAKVAIIDIGMDTAIMKVEDPFLKKIYKITTANSAPHMAELCTLSMEL